LKKKNPDSFGTQGEGVLKKRFYYREPRYAKEMAWYW